MSLHHEHSLTRPTDRLPRTKPSTAVSIPDRDRKILWARLGNKCAMCKASLVAEESARAPAAIVGDEAHIIARSPTGPRGGLLAEGGLDAYENLVVLCKVHHKVIDDRADEYPPERLREIKRQHETWVRQSLEQQRPDYIRLRPDPTHGPVRLKLLVSGRDVWQVAQHSHAFRLGSLSDDSDPDRSDLADEFLDDIKDWAEASAEVADQRANRRVERHFDEWIKQVAQAGLVVYGARRRLLLTGGSEPPSYWWEAIVHVLSIENAISMSSEEREA